MRRAPVRRSLSSSAFLSAHYSPLVTGSFPAPDTSMSGAAACETALLHLRHTYHHLTTHDLRTCCRQCAAHRLRVGIGPGWAGTSCPVPWRLAKGQRENAPSVVRVMGLRCGAR